MIKTLKIRLLPTKEQEQLMWKHVGCSRWIYNYMLDLQKKRYDSGEKYLSAFGMINEVTPLKKQEEYSWLNEVSRQTLDRTCQDVNSAFQNFFSKRTKYPRFKSRKRSKPNFPVRDNIGCVYFQDGYAMLPKIGKVKYKSNYIIPQGNKQKFSNPRVSNKNGKWVLTVGVEYENQVINKTSTSMGIDLGVKELAVVAYGDKQLVFHNINKSKRVRNLKSKLKHLQRKVSRKYHTNKTWDKSRNIEKLEKQIAEIHYHLSNIRQNYIHQTTRKLVDLLPYRVVMEDLNISGMMKNKHLSKQIQEQCFFEFIRQMQYKCEWAGIEFVQVDKFYPSSKTCSHCGNIKHNLKLSDRTFICEECGQIVDRDYNAAINLMKYGM